MACYDLYADQLASLNHGHALWEPASNLSNQQVDVGDVGYTLYGAFHRLFNIHLSADDQSQGRPLPEGFEPLDCGPSHVFHRILRPGPYRSRSVVAVDIDAPLVLTGGGKASLNFSCSRRKGAVLVLPEKAQRVDTTHRGTYKMYMRKHCERWLALAEQIGLSLHMEDLILVTGCDCTTTWAVAAFTSTDFDGHVQLSVDFSSAGSVSFASGLRWMRDENAQCNWGPDPDTSVSTDELANAVMEGGDVSVTPSAGQLPNPINTKYNQCVFVRGFRAKSRGRFFPLKLKATAEPLDLHRYLDAEPDGAAAAIVAGEADDIRDTDVIEGDNRIIDDVHQHTNMLFPVLDFILQSSDVDLAIAHDDDLNPYTEANCDQCVRHRSMSCYQPALDNQSYYGRRGSIKSPDQDAPHYPEKEQMSSGSTLVDTEKTLYYTGYSLTFPDIAPFKQPVRGDSAKARVVSEAPVDRSTETCDRVNKAVALALGITEDIARKALLTGAPSPLLMLAPIPGLDIAGQTLIQIWAAFEQVQTNRAQCLRLTDRCADLLLSIEDELMNAGDDVRTELKAPLDRLEKSFKDVHALFIKHAGMRFLERYLWRDKVLLEIADCDVRLRDASSAFNLAIQIRGRQKENAAVINQIKDELAQRHEKKAAELMQNVRRQQNEIDRTRDFEDLKQLQKFVVDTSDERTLVDVLQVKVDEMPEAIKALENAIDHDKEPRDLGFSGSQESTLVDHWTVANDELDMRFMRTGVDALRRLSTAAGAKLDLPYWTITRYDIRKETKIGGGSFSAVYRGTWKNRIVAIKELYPQETPKNLFKKEMEIWKSLSHENVVQLHGASSASSDPP
ncbi:hypothetical protein EVG20_g860, partial [Dentipellis fragilis]